MKHLLFAAFGWMTRAGGMGDHLPISLPSPSLPDDALPTMGELMHWSSRLTHAAMTVGVAIAAALALHGLGFAVLRRLAQKSGNSVDSAVAARFHQSARWALMAVMIGIADEADPLVAHVWGAVERFVVPALVGWVILSLVGTLAQMLQNRADQVEDEITARSRHTRIALLSRVVGFVVVFLTVAMIMLGIPGVRHVGATLMASAGLIGLAFGAAAQPALKSLIAGLQVALTEPVRIGDFVVVEGESGRVEDIHLSYVVIRTADERRLIVPIARFLDSTFQNWTRVGGITGSVVLPVMPGFAIAPIRQAYERLLGEQASWDGRTGQLLVSEAKVGFVELKLVMSAADPTALAALRQTMREAMLEWLREHNPDALCTQVGGG